MLDGVQFHVRESFMSVNRKGVVRGLHYQKPHEQGKIVVCLRGRVWDVMVDLRRRSPTYRKWHGAELSLANRRAFYIPRGFAHGFLSLEEGSEVLYLCDEKRVAESERGIAYDDPGIGIKWPEVAGVEKTIMSARDRAFGPLRDEDAF